MRWMMRATIAAALLAIGAVPAPAQNVSGSLGKAYSYKICSRSGAPPSTTAAAEAPMASCKVPAGALGPDGCLLIFSNWVGVAQNTTMAIRWHTAAGLGGSGIYGSSLTPGQEARDIKWVCNAAAANAQQWYGGQWMTGTRPGAQLTNILNTAIDTWVNFNGSATAGGTLTLADWIVWVIP